MLHNSEISKGRRVTGYVISLIPSAILVFSGMVKIFGQDLMIDNMSKINMSEEMIYIGVIEILCVVLFWTPKLFHIGFFLLCSYVGGIIVAEIAMGFSPYLGIFMGVMIYVGTLLRKPELSGLDI